MGFSKQGFLGKLLGSSAWLKDAEKKERKSDFNEMGPRSAGRDEIKIIRGNAHILRETSYQILPAKIFFRMNG